MSRDIREITVEFLEALDEDLGESAMVFGGLVISGMMLSLYESKNALEALVKLKERLNTLNTSEIAQKANELPN